MALLMHSILGELCVVVLSILVLVYLWFRNRYTYWSKKGVYSPPTSFPTGHIGELVKGTLQIGQQFEEIYYKTRSHPFVGIYMVHKLALVVNDPELIKTIMVKEFMHFTDHGMVHHEESEPLEGHLFNINGNRWRNIRVRLIPAFTSGKMKIMFDTLVHYGGIMQKVIEPNVSSGILVDVKETLSRYSTDIIGTCVFGIECNSLQSKEPRFRNMSKKSLTLPFYRSAIQIMSLMAPWIVSHLRVSMYQNDVNDFFVKAAHETVKYRTQENIQRNDYLQILMKLWEERKEKNKLNGNEIVEDEDASMTMGDLAAQFFVFFVDGVETSSTTGSFALFELARNPEIQETLRNEIDEVLGKHKGKLTYDCLCEMTYLFQVVEEALRIYPPLPLILRVCTKDFTIPDTEITIEKGTSIMIPILGIHRDPVTYPDPMEFRPDRFSAENKASRHKFTHLPFGEGPRMCMGTRFGMLMTRMGLIHILSQYEVSLDNKNPGPFVYKPNSFILSPLDGINVKLTKRKNPSLKS